MLFGDIKGQDRAISFLQAALANKTIAHAYIFVGPDGVGRILTALAFAKALNCKGSGAEVPCGSCAPCRKIDASNHPDVSVLKAEKDKGSIKIGTIRELIRSVSLTPYEANKKVYIIADAELMTEEASNALLKTLEEPLSESVLILIAENLNSILPTIASRAQIVRFFPMGIDEVKDLLTKGHGIDDQRAHILAHLSSGRLGKALEYNDEDILRKREMAMSQIASGTLFDSDFDGLKREDMKLYLEFMLTWYRDLLVFKVRRGDHALINIDRYDEIAARSKEMGFSQLDKAIRAVISTDHFLDENANPKLAMSVLGANICTK